MTGTGLWLGIDVGTQSVKAALVDDLGELVARASAPLTSTREGDRHEQNPGDWVAAVAIAVANATLNIDASRIQGISCCATSGTICVSGADGRALGPGIMYDDGRAGTIAADSMAAGSERWQRLGYDIQPSWALPKIAWLARNNQLGEGMFVRQQADIIASALVGHPVASDWSHTLKSGYDPQALEWPDEVFEALHLDPSYFPQVVAPGTLLGLTGSDWVLPEGIPVYSGMIDGCAAQIGAGTLSLGDWHSVVGTTLVVKAVSNRLVATAGGAVYSHRSPEPGRWFPGGAASVGAGIISQVLPGADLTALTSEIAQRFPGARGVPISYPLPRGGERFPIVEPDLQGFWLWDGEILGLEEVIRIGDPARLLASIMMGVALVERLAVDTLGRAGSPISGSVTTSGGGSLNPWWVELRASILGRTITVPAFAEGSLGMAVLASWASDPAESLAHTGRRMSGPSHSTGPSASAAPLEGAYGEFTELIAAEGWRS